MATSICLSLLRHSKLIFKLLLPNFQGTCWPGGSINKSACVCPQLKATPMAKACAQIAYLCKSVFSLKMYFKWKSFFLDLLPRVYVLCQWLAYTKLNPHVCLISDQNDFGMHHFIWTKRCGTKIPWTCGNTVFCTWRLALRIYDIMNLWQNRGVYSKFRFT